MDDDTKRAGRDLGTQLMLRGLAEALDLSDQSFSRRVWLELFEGRLDELLAMQKDRPGYYLGSRIVDEARTFIRETLSDQMPEGSP